MTDPQQRGGTGRLPSEPPPPPPAHLPRTPAAGSQRSATGRFSSSSATLVGVALVSGLVGLAVGRMSAGEADGTPGSGGIGRNGQATVAPASAGAIATNASPSSGGQVVDVELIRLELPDDWTVVSTDADSIHAQPPGGFGSLLLDGGRGFASVDALRDAIITGQRTGNPDLQICREPSPTPVPGGPADGTSFALCYTLTGDNGEPVPFGSIHFLGVDVPIGSAPENAAWFSYTLLAPASDIDRLVELVNALPPPTWKLYEGS